MLRMQTHAKPADQDHRLKLDMKSSTGRSMGTSEISDYSLYISTAVYWQILMVLSKMILVHSVIL